MKQSSFDRINNQVISLLEKGVVPWKQSWTNSMPQNFVTKRPYNGWNFFWLEMEKMFKDYKTNYWMTFKQCRDKGGYIKKGEKATEVFFWKPIEILNKETKKKEKSMILRNYYVFNFDQCAELELPEKIENEERPSCKDIVERYTDCPSILDSAYPHYNVQKDYVGIPDINEFTGSEEYYSTLFHELIHSTGAKQRLNRKELVDDTYFGSDPYAKEELVAELGAAYLCAHAGIDNEVITNQAAYIKSWMKRFKEDKTLLVRACSKAQKAFDYIYYGSKEKA